MSENQMRLRYDGVCRLCANALPAGSVAVYERSTRTVRCVGCAVATSAPPADEDAASGHMSAASPTPPTPLDDLKLRPPAAAVIAETLRQQATAPPRSRLARILGRSPLTEQSLPWYLGAIGELEVARELDRLGPEWQVVHALPVGSAGSDVDHVVVGPGGVFTINTKHHEGQNVWVGSRRMLIAGHASDHLRNSRHEARRVAKMLSQAARRPVSVRPIVAIVAAGRITFKERPEDVAVLRATELVRWLKRQAAALAVDDVDQLSRVIRDPRTWAIPAVEAPDLAAFARLRAEVAEARRTRRLWGAGILALSLAVLGLLPFVSALL